MSMINSKGSKARIKPISPMRTKRPKGGADGPSLAAFLNDAIDDIEAGVEFWKTLDANRRVELGHSSEFLNRGG